jgi:hypothetical protein
MLKAISTITNALGALNYKGTWNASSNTPTLADGTGAKGDYYVTSTAGTQTFGGLQLFFGIGDWIVYNGAVWQRVEGGSDGNFANVTLTSTDAGSAAAPLLDLYRDSASPAVSDTLGEIEFNGEDSAGNKQQYAIIHGSILSPTSTAEAGQIHFETATAGASTEKMIIGTSNLVINDIGAIYNVRIEGDTDANLFYTDATNSRIGVGTISPAEKLDVVGNIKLSGNVIVGSGQGISFAAAGGDVLTYYDEVTSASTACQNAITTDCVWKLTKIGNQVTITLPKVTGTAGGSNVNFVLGANIPSAYRPTADIGFYGATIINNGAVVTAPGFILITSTGTIIVYRDSGGATVWTNGATAGLNEALGISWTI